MKIATKILFNSIYTVVVLAVLALALLFVGTKISLLGYEAKIVQSGSMEPAIPTGSVVIIAPSPIYNVGDVITFGRDTRTHVPVTHRILEKTGEGRSATYQTKGDANEERDQVAVRGYEVIGKVAFHLPYIGYVIDFARTPLGFLLLIGIPAAVIILDEMSNIVWEIKVYRARKRRKENFPMPGGRGNAPQPFVPKPHGRPTGHRGSTINFRDKYVLDLRSYKLKRTS